MNKFLKTVLAVSLFSWGLVAALPSTALAYLDPNTGNLIFQALLPVITFFVAVYLFFKKTTLKVLHSLRDLFKKWFRGEKREIPEEKDLPS